MTTERVDTDLIIAGGGLAGATLALALARLVPELKVTVVEAFPLSPEALPEDYQPSYDSRSTALAWVSFREPLGEVFMAHLHRKLWQSARL